MAGPRRGEMTDAGRKTCAEAIRDRMPKHQDGKFGFPIYRVWYGEDEAFERFVELLTAHANAQLDKDDTGDQIKHLLDWNVHDNENELNGASIDQIRDRFNEWVRSVNGSRGTTRYAHCIYADAESINSVLTGDKPGSKARHDILNPTAFVKIIDYSWTSEVEQLGPDEEPDEELRSKLNSSDEGYPPINGCRMEDVGWMKVAASTLIPRMYEALMKSGWPSWYVRPPRIQSD